MALCDLCGSPTVHDGDEGETRRVSCYWCGSYSVEHAWRDLYAKDTNFDSPVRVALRGWARRNTDNFTCDPAVISVENFWDLAEEGRVKTPIEQLHRFIELAVQAAPHFGGPSVFDSTEAMAIRLYFPSGPTQPDILLAQVGSFMSALRDCNYIKDAEPGECKFNCILAGEGWRLAEALERQRSEGPPPAHPSG